MASSEVVPPMWRCLMPVRSVIQASLVSRVAERSSLVTILSGTLIPQPVTIAPGMAQAPWRTWMPTTAASPEMIPPVFTATPMRAPGR
jgi:hypothetical protein